MDRGIQVVDQLRADRRLRHDESHSGERAARIAIEHLDEVQVSVGRLEAATSDFGSTRICKIGERRVCATKKRSKLTRRLVARLVHDALRGVGEHELVALFDCVATSF